MSEPAPSGDDSTITPAEAVVDDAAGKRRWLRLGALAVVIVALGVIAERTGLVAQLSQERVRATVEQLGPLGALVFVALFVVGELVHVPGFVFVGAAILAYGRLLGGVLGYVGALAAVAVTFLVVRAIGGQALASIEQPRVRAWLSRVDDRPVLVIAGLRTVLIMTPALTYALALTRVRFRDYMVGSALGLVLPIAAMAILFDWLFAQ
jgi:uncharacterized membrane protein YdjX (TVP38/TMEM64 family)